jgi:hypothetical protein
MTFSKGSEVATANFLHTAKGSLSSEINDGKQPATSQPQGDALVASSFSPGKALTVPLELSIIVPRAGKFQVTLHRHGLVATKTNAPDTKLLIPHGSVTHMIFFPKPEDCKKASLTGKMSKKMPLPPAHLLLLCVHPPIALIGASSSTGINKPVSQICLQLPSEKTVGAVRPESALASDEDDSPVIDQVVSNIEMAAATEDATNAWKRLLVQSLGPQAVVARVGIPGDSSSSNVYQFLSHCDPRSSSTTSGMPFVKCYQGVNDGVLYPLPEGLLFFK